MRFFIMPIINWKLTFIDDFFRKTQNYHKNNNLRKRLRKKSYQHENVFVVKILIYNNVKCLLIL